VKTNSSLPLYLGVVFVRILHCPSNEDGFKEEWAKSPFFSVVFELRRETFSKETFRQLEKLFV
jgi:hypothetical protein